MIRVGCYIDGFNLYHAIDDLQKPHLKWLDLHALAQSLCRSGEQLTKVAYFSAFATWLPDKYGRHRLYVTALRQSGVECHMARFSEQSARCNKCGHTWKHHEEKETDVHFSLTFLEDAIDGVFDRAIIISADSDHAPAVRCVRNRFPGKEVFVATPPKRHSNARELMKFCSSSLNITPGRIARCLLPQVVIDQKGNEVVRRPISYDPPQGWTPPSPPQAP
jgi:uncharacterized LabA/DUF88 family protein